jgi:mercuric ion transport protein
VARATAWRRAGRRLRAPSGCLISPLETAKIRDLRSHAHEVPQGQVADLAAGVASIHEGQKRPDLGSREAEFPTATNEDQSSEVSLVKDPVAARGTRDTRQQSFPLIVTNRLHIDASLLGQRSDGQFGRGLAHVKKRLAAVAATDSSMGHERRHPASTISSRAPPLADERGMSRGSSISHGAQGRRMTEKGLLRIGICGTAVAALCCFTPVLVVLLGAVGLSAAVGWLDYVLFPALVSFLGLTVFALWKRRSA